MTIQYHSDTLWHGYCLMGNTNVCCPIPWDVSHWIPRGMTFLWTSLQIIQQHSHLSEAVSMLPLFMLMGNKDVLPCVAEPFSKWEGTSARWKEINSKFCGV